MNKEQLLDRLNIDLQGLDDYNVVKYKVIYDENIGAKHLGECSIIIELNNYSMWYRGAEE